MKISARTDVEMPREQVFAAASDFEAAEQRLVARGALIVRTETRLPPAAGIAWSTVARLRGRNRKIDSTLTRYSPPEGFEVISVIGGMTVTFDLKLVALAPARTRIIVGFDLRASTFKARVVLQALRLGKRRLSERLSQGLATWADALGRSGPG
jgi:hypothetical protein